MLVGHAGQIIHFPPLQSPTLKILLSDKKDGHDKHVQCGQWFRFFHQIAHLTLSRGGGLKLL